MTKLVPNQVVINRHTNELLIVIQESPKGSNVYEVATLQGECYRKAVTALIPQVLN